MEAVLALAIGILVACGVWLLLRPRTFQVIIGLALLSYGVNLFIFAMGRPRIGAAPLPGFATTLADRPLTHGPAAWPPKREEDAWRQIVAAVPAERQAARWTFAQSLIGRARAVW